MLTLSKSTAHTDISSIRSSRLQQTLALTNMAAKVSRIDFDFPLKSSERFEKLYRRQCLYSTESAGQIRLPEGKGWDSAQTVEYAKRLQAEGVDLLDVSSGGNHKDQKIPSAPGFQVPLAAAVKKAVPNLVVGTVGIITDGVQANEVCPSHESLIVDFGEWKCGCYFCR